MSSKPDIRPALPSDLPAIVAMRDRLNVHELEGCAHASIRRLKLAEFSGMWAASLDDPDYCWRVVDDNGQAVGYGLIYLSKPRTDPPSAFVHWAYVEAAHRRRGVGEELIAQLVKWATERGADRIELQYIDGNNSAENFWAKMGFVPFARKAVRYLT